MLQIHPLPEKSMPCKCGSVKSLVEIIWQGVHICEKYLCSSCSELSYISLPVNQGILNQLIYHPSDNKVMDSEGNVQGYDWYSSKLATIDNPEITPVELKTEVFRNDKEIILLNTLDSVYGHSILFLFNLQRITESDNHPGIIVIVQPMLRWLVPENLVSEIWTADLGFKDLSRYYPDLSGKINRRIAAYEKVSLSKGYPVPTNRNIKIELFSGISPFRFDKVIPKPGITFIWRQDPDRLWIRNYYILKGFKKLKISFLLLPLHLLRYRTIIRRIKGRLGNSYTYSVAGLGKYGIFQRFINDSRISGFTLDAEKNQCEIFSKSIIVIGMHGSSMILPSAHAGMAISIMPSRRWGNFGEDILYNESDVRLASFQRRIIPVSVSLSCLTDIIEDMVTGRDYFIRKFIHSDEL